MFIGVLLGSGECKRNVGLAHQRKTRTAVQTEFGFTFIVLSDLEFGSGYFVLCLYLMLYNPHLEDKVRLKGGVM